MEKLMREKMKGWARMMVRMMPGPMFRKRRLPRWSRLAPTFQRRRKHSNIIIIKLRRVYFIFANLALLKLK